MSQKCFVLVHGAWHGGWCWQSVQDRLVAAGCDVIAPTLAGLGQRAGERFDVTSIDTHVQNVVDAIEQTEFDQIVLVGHSYGGIVITGVADRLAARLKKLVFLDAVIVESGERWCDMHSYAEADRRMSEARLSDDFTFKPPPASRLGLSDPAQCKWVEAQMTPHPAMTYQTPLILKNRFGNGLPKVYIECCSPASPNLESSRNRVRMAPDWCVIPIQTGHDAMISAPDMVVQTLLVPD